MSITQLACQAVVTQKLIEENDYKVHIFEVTKELTGKTIDDIWDAINGGIGGDIVERIEVVEDKTHNINHNSDISLFNGYWFSFNQNTENLQLKNQKRTTTITLSQGGEMTINTLNIVYVKGLTAEEVIYKHSTEAVLGGNNGPKTHSEMYEVKLGSDKQILLAGIENELSYK
jgi:hypothetical protein